MSESEPEKPSLEDQRYEAVEINDTVVIHDRENGNAWIQSDTTVDTARYNEP